MDLHPAKVRLVVNADGFGMSAERTQGVLAGHLHGIVTSTSVLGNVADPHAIKAALAPAPNLGVGVLLSLEGGFPVAQPETVPSLVGSDGRFPSRARDVLLNWAKAILEPADIEREFAAQVARFRDLGLVIDHLCARSALGFLPSVTRAIENVARKHGIAGLRMAVERPTLAWAADPPRGMATAMLGALAWYSRRQLGFRRHGPQSWGYFESGRLDEIRILEILGRMGPGSHEIICQPDLDSSSQWEQPPEKPAGPRDLPVPPCSSSGGDFAFAGCASFHQKQGEVAALTSARVFQAISSRNIELCRWSDLF